jgi:hypothetical protein
MENSSQSQGEVRESELRKKLAKEKREQAKLNKEVSVWYEVKFGKKLLECKKKASGATYRKFVCMVDKKDGKEYLQNLQKQGQIVKGI